MNSSVQFNTSKFIEAVRTCTALWDPSDKGYHLRRVKQSEWTQIGKYFRITPAQAGHKWVYLQNKYKKERQKKSSDWPLFKSLRFLEGQINYVQPQFTESTLADKEINEAMTKFGATPIRRPITVKSPLKSVQNASAKLLQQQQQCQQQGKPKILNKQTSPINPVELTFQTSTTQVNAIERPKRLNTTVPNDVDSNATEIISPIMMQHSRDGMNKYWTIVREEDYDEKNGDDIRSILQNGTGVETAALDATVEEYDFVDDENSDYKSRCRSFGKYLGEELCTMDETVGDALIVDILKIILDERAKRQNSH